MRNDILFDTLRPNLKEEDDARHIPRGRTGWRKERDVRTNKRTRASSDAAAINIHDRVKTRIILLLVPLLHNKSGKNRQVQVYPVLVHSPP